MSYSEKLKSVSDEIYKAIQAQVDLLTEGTTLMLVGNNMVVKTSGVKHIVVSCIDNQFEGDYQDLPYGYKYDKHGNASQYKIAGITKSNGGFALHLHSWDELVDYRVEEKDDIEVSLEVMADIADMI